jgi:hypothetical protein
VLSDDAKEERKRTDSGLDITLLITSLLRISLIARTILRIRISQNLVFDLEVSVLVRLVIGIVLEDVCEGRENELE